MLETIEDTQKDVLGIAQDKACPFTVLLEVIEVVAEGGHLLLLQHALDVACRKWGQTNINASKVHITISSC